MKKFLISEQEKKHILGLYEQTQNYSEYQKEISNLLEIPIEEFNLFYKNRDLLKNPKPDISQVQIIKQSEADNFGKIFFSSMFKFAKTPGKLSEIGNKMSDLGSDNPEDYFLKQFIRDFSEGLKKGLDKTFEGMSDETKEKHINKQVEPRNFFTKKNSQSQNDEKINTTNDKAYDYKFSNGKYFYSKKDKIIG